MLTKDENLEFLKQKMQEIRSAKFSAEINSLLQLPNNVITIINADNEGNVWFFTSCNGTYANNMDKSFYASLDFYNKASDSRLHIDGNATIIDDEKEIQTFTIPDSKKSFAYNIVLIKLKIVKAEYFEAKLAYNQSLKETIKNIFVQLFYSDTHKQFNFFEAIPSDY
jgi:general stress protein 26